jgi:hypothetical protein
LESILIICPFRDPQRLYHLTSILQFEIVEDWFAINWSGVCKELSKVTIPTLATGTEDVSILTANDLTIAQKISEACSYRLKMPGMD